MIKADLVRIVANEVGISRALAKQVIDLATHKITASLSTDERVQLLGFGTFFLKTRKGRILKLPMSTIKVDLPDRYVIKFVPGKRFLQKLSGYK